MPEETDEDVRQLIKYFNIFNNAYLFNFLFLQDAMVDRNMR